LSSAIDRVDFKFRYAIHFPWLLFPASVLLLYLALWVVAPEKTWLAMRNSLGILYHVLPSLFLVFLLMVGLNLFLKPPHFSNMLRKGAGIRRTVLAVAAGIVSTGPIYAWYPMLKDLRERGADQFFVAVFLVNRAVKPFLLPVMISMFGWAYVLILTLLTVTGSLFVGFVVGAWVDSPTGSRRNGKDWRTDAI
jgi:uncharacterized membrane protein YraQ (UPF0718 family)